MGSGLARLHLEKPAGCETALGLVAWFAGAWDIRPQITWYNGGFAGSYLFTVLVAGVLRV